LNDVEDGGVRAAGKMTRGRARGEDRRVALMRVHTAASNLYEHQENEKKKGNNTSGWSL